MPASIAGAGVPNDQLVRYSSTMTIEELTGSGDGGPRKLVLRGPSMPFQGADWGGGTALTTTFYPGNRIGTQQNLGPKEMPSGWEGEWRRTMLGKAPVVFTDETGADIEVINPHSLWDIFEDIFRKGAALRVTWSTHGAELVGSVDVEQRLKIINFDVVRDGRPADWKFSPDRHTDIKWTINWQWYGRGEEQNRVANVREDNDLASAANALENSIAFTRFLTKMKAISLKDDIRKSASHFTLGQLEALADAPNKLVTDYTRKLTAAVNDAKRVGNLVQKIRDTPYQLANTVTDFARNSLTIANQFRDSMGRIPPEQMSNKRRVADLMRAWTYFNKQSEFSSENSKRAQDLTDRTRRFVVASPGTGRRTVSESSFSRAGDVLATYITKDGDSPQTVSKRFYGTPDRGLDILQANRLPWHTPIFERGRILIIPVLPPQQRV